MQRVPRKAHPSTPFARCSSPNLFAFWIDLSSLTSLLWNSVGCLGVICFSSCTLLFGHRKTFSRTFDVATRQLTGLVQCKLFEMELNQSCYFSWMSYCTPMIIFILFTALLHAFQKIPCYFLFYLKIGLYNYHGT